MYFVSNFNMVNNFYSFTMEGTQGRFPNSELAATRRTMTSVVQHHRLGLRQDTRSFTHHYFRIISANVKTAGEKEITS